MSKKKAPKKQVSEVPYMDPADTRIGLIVTIDAQTIGKTLELEDLACGLLAPGADSANLLEQLHEAGFASLVDFSTQKPDETEVDSILVSAIDFAEASKNESRQVAVQATSRHQAMEYAEQGADLLIFDAASETGLTDAAWWIEMMELACALDFRGVDTLPTDHTTALADFWIVKPEQL